MKINSIKNDLKNTVVSINTTNINWFNITENKHLVRKKMVTISDIDKEEIVECEIWTDVISKSIEEHKCIYIPNMNYVIYIDNPIVLQSDYHIKVDPKQTIALLPGTDTCLIRNQNIIVGREREVELLNSDTNISIEGGIWSTLAPSTQISNGNLNMGMDREYNTYGHAVMLFSNIRQLNIKNVTFHNCKCHAIQISNCDNFICEDIEFINHHRDGIHLNGPVKNGNIKNIKGENMGDDMIAINAWDWYHTVLTFGTIENILVEDVFAKNNEVRLLPGRKMFKDGKYVECHIRNCVFENISGVYTYKMYCQPNSEISDHKDASGTVGNINNVYFNRINFDKVTGTGFFNVPTKGLFDICSDCSDIHFSNIKTQNSKDELDKKDISLVKVGPLSFNFKISDDVWIEAFTPDAICTADNIYFENISFGGKQAFLSKNNETLIRSVALEVNLDFPNTLPKGGTGYGIIENVFNDAVIK